MTEDERVERHHQLDGHEFEQALGVGDGHGGLACCDSWGCKESDTTEQLNWIELKLVTVFLLRSKQLFNFIAAVNINSDFGSQENKICHCFHFSPIYLPWSDGTGCHDLRFFEYWVLNQPFHSPLSPVSIGSLVPLRFLPLECYHVHIWSCWYSSQQSWF